MCARSISIIRRPMYFLMCPNTMPSSDADLDGREYIMAKSINVPFSSINVTASSFINEPCSLSPPAPLDRHGNAPPPSCAAGAIHPPARSFPPECCAMREKRFRLYAARAFYIGRRSLLLLEFFVLKTDRRSGSERRTNCLPVGYENDVRP